MTDGSIFADAVKIQDIAERLRYLDRVCDGKVLLAFGHQHLGLTQAAITAEWIASLAGSPAISADTPQALPDLSTYRLARFA